VRILLSNDDGYQARGIATLAEALRPFAEVKVVAPDRDRSGASNSLTLDNPIRAEGADNAFIRVNGTPTDCVHLALTGLLVEQPDMVISGINAGPNLGDDVLYSGTVAAAMEGRFLGFPAMAVSLAGAAPEHYDSAAKAAVLLLERLLADPLPSDTILNVNVPDLPWERVAGFEATRLGHRHKSEGVVRSTDPRGRTIFWVGPAGPEQDAGAGTDFHAVRRGFVSITPLQIDLTRYAALDKVAAWVQGLEPASR
jgi:5'-nucleotidase